MHLSFYGITKIVTGLEYESVSSGLRNVVRKP